MRALLAVAAVLLLLPLASPPAQAELVWPPEVSGNLGVYVCSEDGTPEVQLTECAPIVQVFVGSPL